MGIRDRINKAQNSLRILSGLYGMLKPLDLIQPYRLEMGTKLNVEGSVNLYGFWKNKITNKLNDELLKDEFFINLASNEYSSVIDNKTLNTTMISPSFKDMKNGKLKIIAQVGVGYDNISVKSAEARKIKVSNTPNVLNEAVAETTILLILAASRRIGEAYNLVRSGTWKDQKPDLTKFMIGNSVTGKTLGIIGMGLSLIHI